MKRQWALWVVSSCLALAFLVLLFLPIALATQGKLSDPALSRLSNVGQAYGVVSALLSAVALGGVAASLYYQARQHRMHRVQVWREAHSELLRMVINEPSVFGPCIGDHSENMTSDEYRQFLFTTLWINYARMGFEMGQIPLSGLRGELVHDMVRTETARKLWRIRRNIVLPPDRGRDYFYSMVDEEYERTVKSQTVVEKEGTAGAETASTVGDANRAI
jgi:hypothetical protein